MIDPTLLIWLRAKLPDLLRPLIDRLIAEQIKKIPYPSIIIGGGSGGPSGNYDPAGTAAAAIAVHGADLDAHPIYTTAAEAQAVAPVQSVAGRVGDVALVAADIAGLGMAATRNVGASAGTVAAGDHSHTGVYEPANAVATHVAAADPHPQYHTNARGDARYSLLAHGHAIAAITGLQAALDGKLATNSIQIERVVIAAGATAVFTAKDKALYAVVLWQTWSALFFAHHPTPGSGLHTAFASIYQGANIAYSTTLVSGKFAAYMDSQSRLCVINGHASAALPVVVIAVGGG